MLGQGCVQALEVTAKDTNPDPDPESNHDPGPTPTLNAILD